MVLGSDRSREEPAKSKTRSLTALGQSLRRGLTTRRTQKANAESTTNDISNRTSAQLQPLSNQQGQQSQGQQHLPASSSKTLGYTPSPLSRGAIPSSMKHPGASSLGLGGSESGKPGGVIYGNARSQRIASASSSHLGTPAAAAHAGSASTAATGIARKTIYGSTGLAGLSKSGFNNSTPSLGSASTSYSTGASEAQTISRKGPPPEPHSSGNIQNRDYSFAIAGNISKSISNGSSGETNSIGNSGNVASGAGNNKTISYSIQSARSSAGAAVPIAKEGYLSKKTDINPSTSLASALSRGWKVYRVVLKGAKLFFYKPPSESELRAMFPEEIAAASNETAGGYVRASISTGVYEEGYSNASSGFPMAPGEVESGSRTVLFEPGVRDGEISPPLCERYVFGECFTEVDLRSLKFKRYVCVLIFDDTIVILKRRWVRQGIASSFFGAVSNKMRFGKGSRSKAPQATDNSSLVSAELGIQGKGYFTKWKYHSQYPLTNVEAIEAASSRFSVAHAPGVLGHIGRESQAGSSRISLYSIGNSSVSSIMTRTSTVSKDYSGALSSGLVPGFQIFVGGKERVARMFVATTSDAKNNWLSRFAAAKASYARRLRQRPRESTAGARRYNGGAGETARRPTASAAKEPYAEAANVDDKPKQAKDIRARLYWGVQRHPELVVAPAPNATDESAVIVVGGSKSALVHEMVFCTTSNLGTDTKPGKDQLLAQGSSESHTGVIAPFSSQLLVMYRLFMDDSEFMREFQRYSELVTPELENYPATMGNLRGIVAALAAHYTTTFHGDQIEILRSIVAKTIASASDVNEASLADINSAIDRMVPVIDEKPTNNSEDTAGKQLINTIETGNDTVLIKSPASSKLFSYEIVSPPVMQSTSESSGAVAKPSSDGPLRGRSKTHHGEPEPTVPQIPSVPELVRVEVTGLSPSLLLRIPPAEFAHQLYLFHRSQLTEFNPKQVELYVSIPSTSQQQRANKSLHQAPPSLLTVGANNFALDAEHSPAASAHQHGFNTHTLGFTAGGAMSASPAALTADSATNRKPVEALLEIQRQLMVFTQSEPHFLTRLVHHQLLVDLPLNRPARRSALLQHWVRIGEECKIIGDAVSWAAIAIAVTMAPIARLRETWHGVALAWKDLIVSEWVPLLISYGIYDVDIELSAKANHAKPLVIKPRAIQKGNENVSLYTSADAFGYNYTPIPYYGPIRMSADRQGRKNKRLYESTLAATSTGDSGDKLLFIHHGRMYTSAQEAIGNIPDSVVERARSSMMRSRASSVSLATKFQKTAGAISSRTSTENLRRDSVQIAQSTTSPLFTVDPSLLAHPYLQSYLATLAANPLKVGDELVESDMAEYDLRYLLSISLQCEPAVADQYHQHILQDTNESNEDTRMSHLSLRQAPGSILPLVCPETVPSTNILQWITPAARTPAAPTPTSIPVGRAGNASGRAGTFSHASQFPATGAYQPEESATRPQAPLRKPSQGQGPDLKTVVELDSAVGTAQRASGSQESDHALKHKRSRSFPANSVAGMHAEDTANSTVTTPSNDLGSTNSVNGASSTASGAPSAAIRVEQQISDAAQSNAFFAGSTIYTANGDLSLRVLRVQYVHGREPSTTVQPLRFVVEVQGGTLATLLDLLINGIEHLSAGITNDKGAPLQLPNGAKPLLIFNRDVFQRIFMASFRHFCIGLDVIDSMRRTLSSIENKSWQDSIHNGFSTLLDLCENWLGHHFSDFLDSVTLCGAMAEFLHSLEAAVRKAAPSDDSSNSQSMLAWKELHGRARLLLPDFVTQLLAPSGYTPLDKVLENRMTFARNRERRTSNTRSQLDMSAKSPVSLLSVADPDVILISLNRLAQAHFARCSFNDWLVTFCLLEVQTHVPLPWYPKKRVAHIPSEDDLVVSDIYQVLEQTHRVFGSGQARDIKSTGANTGAGVGVNLSASTVETALVRTLPQSIQSMLELHRIIRSWVIRQITDPTFSLSQRVSQIQKFVTIVKLCRKDSHLSSSRVFGNLLNSYMREAGMIPDRQPSYRANSIKRYSVAGANSRVAGETGKRGKRRGGSGQTQVKYVPSFIERAIASALVSPESRQFVRAWNEVAAENNTKLDTLESVLRGARDWAAFDPMPKSLTEASAEAASDSTNDSGAVATSISDSGVLSKESEGPKPIAVQRSRSNPVSDDIDISEDSMARADCFVPCLGWLLENMVSLCYDTPDTLVGDSRLINLAKRHRVFIMLCICEQLGSRCQEAFALPTDIRVDIDQLSTWVAQTPLQADELKATSQNEAMLVTATTTADPTASAQANTSQSSSNPAYRSSSSSSSVSNTSSATLTSDRAFSFSVPSSHASGFVRTGDTIPSMRHMHGGGGFAKRSIANLRSTSGSGCGPAGSIISSGELGAGGNGNPGSSNSPMQIFGSPPAPAPRSLAYADGPNGIPSAAGSSTGAGIAAYGGPTAYARPFARLVNDEIEKARQEIRERERLERELRDREQAIERQRNERTRILKRQLKEQQQRRAKNEPLLKMANLMNKVGIGARESSMDGGGPSSKGALSAYGGVAALQALPEDTNRMSSSSGTMRPRGPALPNAKPANVINLINSTITVEHGYTKRDYVFRIVTEEGGQYLLQAPDIEQMDDWISAMRDAATEAAARRLTLFVEEAKRRNNNENSSGPSAHPASESDSSSSTNNQQQMQGRIPGSDTTRSRFTAFLGGSAAAFSGFSLSSQAPSVPSRGALSAINQQPQSREPVAQGEPKSFGVDLAKLMPDPKVVPTIVEKCLTEIELRGLEEIGIYRVSGAAADVSRLRQLFNTDPEAVDLSLDDFQDINVVSGVMKQFLRELPEPLMTYNLYDGFINAASIDDYDERLWAIKDLVHALPIANYTVLKRLVEHLERVTDCEEVNHMYGTNLALVFGPSLLRPPPGSSSFALAMSNLGHAQSVIKNLILQYHWLFNVEEEAEPIDEDGELATDEDAPVDGTTISDGSKRQSQNKEGSSASSGRPVDSAADDGDYIDEDEDSSGVKQLNKRESIAASPLSPSAQADMDQLAMAVNKLSV
ncbi:hypothetical protein GGI25_002166 [Coemansia spiralis]|uniref:Uncharacterized protein n=2 Tax=Coemansia TaxID=4863 RepID=A0A9W8KXN8_9FUNG|nr:hypothetical protein EDC05_000065 [Coemansia umbellata]KAJ2626068.1 hypothetical protein GGI26_000152 [Coemansia sp. RSA 1358]KAJ2678578.1 hypothetical protein GGI25_002166 [Coemansia spiralis]